MEILFPCTVQQPTSVQVNRGKLQHPKPYRPKLKSPKPQALNPKRETPEIGFRV